MLNFQRVLCCVSKCKTLNYATYQQLSTLSKKAMSSGLSNEILAGNKKNVSGKEFLGTFLISSSQIRLKSYNEFRKSKSKPSEYESGSDSDSDDEILQESLHGSKVAQIQTDSLRCDLILKNGLGISRNKLEVHFYEGRIRVNGLKIMKKSSNVKVGDEVDVIKNIDEENPNFLRVGRVEILKAKPIGDYILLTIRKSKSMLIENYEKDPWEEKQPEDENEENKKDDETEKSTTK